MSMLPLPDVPQGVYRHFNGTIMFVVYQPVDEWYMYKYFDAGDVVGDYSSGYRRILPSFLRQCTCLAPGWLSTDTVISDTYPELFI